MASTTLKTNDRIEFIDVRRWWKEYADRKADEEDEHVADSLLYDRNHLPRAAPPPESVFEERAREKALLAAAVNFSGAESTTSVKGDGQ